MPDFFTVQEKPPLKMDVEKARYVVKFGGEHMEGERETVGIYRREGAAEGYAYYGGKSFGGETTPLAGISTPSMRSELTGTDF